MRGFSLLEIIIAISILSTGVAGAVALINRTISLGSEIRVQFIASGLAQEGMEVVHNIRNTNWIEQRDLPLTSWDDGLIDGNACVNFDSTVLISPDACGNVVTEDRRLYLFDDGTKVNYTHTSTPVVTDFLRHVNISTGDDAGTPFKLVQSIVEWDGGSIIVEERLYDWK